MYGEYAVRCTRCPCGRSAGVSGCCRSWWRLCDPVGALSVPTSLRYRQLPFICYSATADGVKHWIVTSLLLRICCPVLLELAPLDTWRQRMHCSTLFIAFLVLSLVRAEPCRNSKERFSTSTCVRVSLLICNIAVVECISVLGA